MYLPCSKSLARYHHIFISEALHLMLKHISLLIALSFLMLIFSHHTQMILVYLHRMHEILNDKLGYIFTTSTVGNTFQETTCLLLIPFALVGIPASIYWLLKRRLIPYFYHMLWCVWIVLFTSLLIMR